MTTKSAKTKPLTKLALSIVLPTRDRADYLHAAIRTCLLSTLQDYEVLVLDNASVDGTREVIAAFDDKRLRYQRSEVRLSMRDNFERGLDHARGEVIGFIGDDDGIFDFTPERVLRLFERHSIDAIAAARAHYGWPDLKSPRRDTGLLPRGTDITIRQSKQDLRGLLRHNDYYRLPCVYHGFVRASVVRNVRKRQGRMFLSSQVDIFSAIALSMENIQFAYSESPLIINGGSSRSNGASHFGGGSNVEKANWKMEDDLGFLPGFADHATLGSLIVESAIRYCQQQPQTNLHDIFPIKDVRLALHQEHEKRIALGRPLTDFDQTWVAANLIGEACRDKSASQSLLRRLRHLGKAFTAMRPIDMHARGVHDVLQASEVFNSQLLARSTGYFTSSVEQIRVAARIASGRAH